MKFGSVSSFDYLSLQLVMSGPWGLALFCTLLLSLFRLKDFFFPQVLKMNITYHNLACCHVLTSNLDFDI